MALRNDILKPGGYASVPHCVLKSSRLAPSDKLVYQILLDHLGDNETSWPGLRTIANRTAMSVRCVRYAIRRLQTIGLIYSVESPKDEHDNPLHRSTDYAFNDPEDVLNISEESAQAAVPSQSGGGTSCRIPSAKAAGDTANVAG
jgi:hypothetical protein